MSRDDREDRRGRETSFSAPEPSEESVPRVSEHVRAVPSDRLLPREFVDELYRLAARDAELLGNSEHVSDRWLIAAEVAAFGLDNEEAAVAAAQTAAEGLSVDSRAFATLRHAARIRNDIQELRQYYADDTERGRAATDRALADLGGMLMDLRAGKPVREALETLGRVKEAIRQLDPQTIALWRALSEDVLIALHKPDRALELRSQRWKNLQSLPETSDDERAALALSAAALAEVAVDSPQEALAWYHAAFGVEPNESIARPMLRWAWKNNDYARLDAILQTLCEHADDADTRASASYQQGMLRAYLLHNVPDGLASLRNSTVSGRTAGLGAAAFLSLARSSHGNAVPHEVVDGLAARLEFAASGMERADLLTQMAERFDAEMQLPDVAIDMAREAIQECPDWTPALRLLGHIYHRDQQWENLVALHASQLQRERDPDVCRTLHERIAEVAYQELREASQAETHLKAALEYGWKSSTAQLLARIYRETGRWDVLYVHQRHAAEQTSVVGECLRLLQDAAEVAERKLHDLNRAVDAWTQALHADPDCSTAIAALERIFHENHRWEDLLRLSEHELSRVQPDNLSAYLTILCRCADIARTRLADLHTAESYYRRALEREPLHEDALRGLGMMLKEQGRWQDLIAMTEQEHDRAVSPERRAKCLRQIGEIYVRELNDLHSGVAAYRRLGALGSQWHEEALLWLERLYEATGDDERLLGVMRGRRELAADDEGRAKLSFRIAEVLEWKLKEYAEALEAYMRAIDEPSVCDEVVAAMERCLSSGEISEDVRDAALQTLTDRIPQLSEPTARAAYDLLLAQAHQHRDSERSESLMDAMHQRWPEDRLIAEHIALRKLKSGDWSAAEHVRASSHTHGADAIKIAWRALDEEGDVHNAHLLSDVPSGAVRAWMARELGIAEGYPGAEDRQTLRLIHNGAISVGELIQPARSWIEEHLAVAAARALANAKELERNLESIAQKAEEPLLEMRLWLDAAGEGAIPTEVRKSWLRRAAATGNYEHALREDVYRALQTTGDTEGLVLALNDHINSGVVQGDALAYLALRRGRALDGLGRQKDAIASLRTAMVHAPSNARIALEKSRIEALSGDLESARSTIESVLSSGCPEEHRQEVYLRLTELHSVEGGDRQRAMEALEEAFQRSGRSEELGIRLAEMHLQFGDARRGAKLLESLLKQPMVEGELHLWILLGRTYAQRLEEIPKAESLLWAAFDAFPMRSESLTQLEEIALRSSRAAEFARALWERLNRSEGSQLPQDRRAKLWLHLGDFQLDTLNRPEEADRSFEAAVEAGANRSYAQRQRARAVAQQDDRAADAAKLLVDAVASTDFPLGSLPDVVGELDRLYAQSGQTSRLRTVRQLRKIFGHATPDVGLADRRAIETPIPTDTLFDVMGDGMLNPRERFVLVESSKLASRVFSKKSLGGMRIEKDRYRPEAYRYFDEHLTAVCAMLDIEVPRLTVAVNGVAATTVDGTSFYVPGPRITDDQPASAKFWAGWIAAMSASKLGLYAQVEDDDIRGLLSAVADSAGDTVNPQWLETAEDIHSIMWISQRRNAESAHRKAPEVAQDYGEGRAQAVRAMGDRFGAAYSDHPGVALYEVLRASGQTVRDGRITSADLRSVPRALDLVRFLLSDDFLKLRTTLGIGSRDHFEHNG